ncbi:MAG: c-type cytochrome [Runella sp.]
MRFVSIRSRILRIGHGFNGTVRFFQCAICFMLLLNLVACTGSHQNTSQQNSDSTQDSTSMAIKSDSMSIYLSDLKSQFPQAEVVTIAYDPVFFKEKKYRAVPFRQILDLFLPAYRNLDSHHTQIVFECEDGYNPSMALEKILSKKAYLALSDLDAPAGQDWINAQKDGHDMKVAPFYVVYTDVSPKDYSFKWPYNLVRISLASASEELAVLFPKEDDTVVKGFELFKINCLTCHALNKVGGKMGPELNYPKNVTEYWRSPDDLKAFIKAPASFRHDCKMPAVGHLSDKELDEIVRYLQYMAKHKLS